MWIIVCCSLRLFPLIVLTFILLGVYGNDFGTNQRGAKANARHLSLINYLLNQTTLIGPRHDDQAPITIALHLQLQQIVEVDFKTQQMALAGWLFMKWKDVNLVWDVDQYKQLYVELKPTDIWFPDVGFINTVDNVQYLKENTVLPIRVNYRGSVTWHQPITIRTLCKMDVSYFPHDAQTCILSVMSFRRKGNELILCHMDKVQGMRLTLDRIQDHPEWTLIHSKKLRQNSIDTDLFISRLQFVFSFKRQAKFYEYSLLFPLTVLSSMALFSFTLPNACGEKILFSITILLSLVVNLSIISLYVPNSSDNFPIVGKFFLVAIVLVGLSVVLNAIVLVVHSSAAEPLPLPQKVWNFVVTKLGKLTFQSERSMLRQMAEANRRSDKCLRQLQTHIDSLRTKKVSQPVAKNGVTEVKDIHSGVEQFLYQTNSQIEATLCDFLTCIRNEDVREVNRVQWMITADILDRIFAISFLTISVSFAVYFRFSVHFRALEALESLQNIYDQLDSNTCNASQYT